MKLLRFSSRCTKEESTSKANGMLVGLVLGTADDVCIPHSMTVVPSSLLLLAVCIGE